MVSRKPAAVKRTTKTDASVGLRPKGSARAPTHSAPEILMRREKRRKRKAANRERWGAEWQAELDRREELRAAREAQLKPRIGTTLEMLRVIAATAPPSAAVLALRELRQADSDRELIKRQAARIAELEAALAQVDPSTLTPEQRVALSLADPVHGPLLRAAAAAASANNEGEDK
jgi:hypothetical protein